MCLVGKNEKTNENFVSLLYYLKTPIGNARLRFCHLKFLVKIHVNFFFGGGQVRVHA